MVKRYVMTEYPHECCMEQDDVGQYVLHDDYAALQAENERLKAERVDLERFRWAVENAREKSLTQRFEDYCNELLALIDAQKGE